MKFSPSPVDHRNGPRCLPAWKIPERYGKFPKNDQRGSKKTPDQRWSPMNLFAKKHTTRNNESENNGGHESCRRGTRSPVLGRMRREFRQPGTTNQPYISGNVEPGRNFMCHAGERRNVHG